MIKLEVIFYILMGIVATLLCVNVINGIQKCTYNGMGAKQWYQARVTAGIKYIDLISCSEKYQQCGYVVDECLKEVEQNQ